MSSPSYPESIIEAARATAEAIAQAAHATAEAIAEAARSATFSSPPVPLSPKLPNLHELCPARKFFHHTSYFLRDYLPASALGQFWLLDDLEPFFLFQVHSLNLAASYIRHYIKTKDTHDWLHVMVKAVSFKSFLTALDADQGKTRTLAFSCWCDGGPYQEVWFRQHRHLIIVSPKGHFETHVWPQVEDIPGLPCKGMKEIEDARHLMNALGYLSKRTSRCEFTLKNTLSQPPEKNHFFIFQTLPVEFRKPLATQWNDGILQLLHQEQLQHASASCLADGTLVYKDAQWQQRIGDFCALERGIVLPIRKMFSPTQKETCYYVFTTEGNKLYFEYDATNKQLSLDAWLQKQVAGGNAFYDILEHKYWTPQPPVQKQLKELMIRVERIRELEKENNVLKQKLVRLKGKLKQTLDRNL